MELIQNLTKNNEIITNILDAANNALETGLRAILPDAIEDDIIEIKDKFIQEGFTEGVKEVIDKIEDVGKSILGIFTGNFETIEQIRRVIKENGLLDGISDVIDTILKKLLDNNKITKNIYNLIKSGKKELLSSMENEIEGLYKQETYDLEKLNQDCETWKKQYEEKDYEGMEKTIKKIKQKLSKNKVIEETIKEARDIEQIQKYIEERGSIENLSENEKELIEKIG